MRALYLISAVSLALSGCSLIPDYQRPEAPVAPAWPGMAAGEIGMAADKTGWRDFFPDPHLQHLIELALANNRDLRVSALNVQSAQATYRAQFANLFPSISATSTETAERIPAGVYGASSGAGAGGAAGGASGGSSGSILRSYDVGVGFTSYELDFFGRIRSLSEQDFELYLSDEETRRSAQISLIAEIASGYLTVLADESLLRITQSTLDSETASYRLTARELDIGTGTALSVKQAETAVATAKASLASYQRQLASDRNALIDLLGASPDPADLTGTDFEKIELMPMPPAELPATVLARRPDIMAAEHQLMAANANIGAARAAFFPSITLTASGGTESGKLSGLFSKGSGAWSFAPEISVPIFTAGQNEANLDLAKTQKNIYVAQYEKAIQDAFRDVADALQSRAALDDQLAAQQTESVAAQQELDLAQLRFNNGVDTYLTVLDSERTLFSAQQTLITVRLTRLQNLVTLYKALGGGSIETSAKSPASAPTSSASAP